MAALTVPITLSPSYLENKYVKIHSVQTALTIPLDVSGSGVITTPLLEIGTVDKSLSHLDNPLVVASISVWYKFDFDHKQLTLCSNNLVSEDSTFLSTFPQAASSQVAKQYTNNADNSPCKLNANWNYCTPLTPGLHHLFHETVCAANQAIIDAAKSHGNLTVVVRTPPPSDIALQWLVYSTNNEFRGFHNPLTNDILLPGEKLIHINSIWWGETTLSPGEYFSNVIGSTGDPQVGGKSWIQLWAAHFGAYSPWLCSSWQFGGGYGSAFPCTNDGTLLGGHSILGTTAVKVPAGSNNVFIMPICAKHNSNDSYYMSAIKNVRGVALHNYLQ
eukprot:gene30985-38290_t